jgi:hypothetical protein
MVLKNQKYKYLTKSVYHHSTMRIAKEHARVLRAHRPDVAVSVKKLKDGYGVYLSEK